MALPSSTTAGQQSEGLHTGDTPAGDVFGDRCGDRGGRAAATGIRAHVWRRRARLSLLVAHRSQRQSLRRRREWRWRLDSGDRRAIGGDGGGAGCRCGWGGRGPCNGGGGGGTGGGNSDRDGQGGYLSSCDPLLTPPFTPRIDLSANAA